MGHAAAQQAQVGAQGGELGLQALPGQVVQPGQVDLVEGPAPEGGVVGGKGM